MRKLQKMFKNITSALSDTSRTYARTPRKFMLKDWKNALAETKSALAEKRIGIMSAGISYFLTFAVFPAIAASVAILGFIISKSQISQTAKTLEDFLPGDIAFLVTTQLETALDKPASGVLIVVFGILIALFSLSGAMSNIINAVNAIYETDGNRKFVKLRIISTGFIAAAGIITALVIALLVLNEAYLVSLGIPAGVALAIIVLRWPVIAALVTIGLAIFYRYAPNRSNPHWQWVTWGSCIATVIWLLGTTCFFIYARYFAHYTESYSVFAGIIVLMTWLNLTSFAVLLGATINFRLENQTRARTTE